MYLIGFGCAYFLIRKQIYEQNPNNPETVALELSQFEAMFMWLVLGVLLGGRLGYVLFYNFSYYLHHPLEILATWHGGMSFHGGVIGTIVAGALFCRLQSKPMNIWLWADRIAVTVPVGLGFGRIGNFINGELYGRPTDVPWAMVFPMGGLVPRHPSQLYEAFLEGVCLFVLLWPIRGKNWAYGRKCALFLAGYAVMRFIVEFSREPDAQLGLLSFGLSMGQVLSIILGLVGLGLVGVSIWQQKNNANT